MIEIKSWQFLNNFFFLYFLVVYGVYCICEYAHVYNQHHNPQETNRHKTNLKLAINRKGGTGPRENNVYGGNILYAIWVNVQYKRKELRVKSYPFVYFDVTPLINYIHQ